MQHHTVLTRVNSPFTWLSYSAMISLSFLNLATFDMLESFRSGMWRAGWVIYPSVQISAFGYKCVCPCASISVDAPWQKCTIASTLNVAGSGVCCVRGESQRHATGAIRIHHPSAACALGGPPRLPWLSREAPVHTRCHTASK